jgi:hypothetical protein
MRGCQCAGRQSTDWHFCFIGHVPWSILPSLICLIRYSLSITSDSVVSFGNTSANSNGRALVRQLMSLSLSTHRRATRLGVWILSVLSECSSQTFSFNRIGVVPLDRSATCSLTLDHLGTRHHLTAQSTATYGRRAMLSSCLGRGRPTRSWRLSVCGTHLPGERKPSYSQLPLRLREIPRLTFPTSSRIAG